MDVSWSASLQNNTHQIVRSNAIYSTHRQKNLIDAFLLSTEGMVSGVKLVFMLENKQMML